MTPAQQPRDHRWPASVLRLGSRPMIALIGAVVLVVAVAGCSANATDAGTPAPTQRASRSPTPWTSPPDPSAVASASASVEAQHGAGDVAFAQQMIVHHRGAVEMAQLAPDRASDQRVLDLASRIRGAQEPEIAEMTGWLQAWGEPAAAADAGSSGGHDMDAMGMSTHDMATLQGSSGAEFDAQFLDQMTVHHQGAVQMARDELAHGSNPQAMALASRIESSQSAEIGEMAQLLQSIGS